MLDDVASNAEQVRLLLSPRHVVPGARTSLTATSSPRPTAPCPPRLPVDAVTFPQGAFRGSVPRLSAVEVPFRRLPRRPQGRGRPVAKNPLQARAV